MINEIKSFEERKDELLALGKKNGNKVTFEEMAEHLKGIEPDSDSLDELYNMFVQNGIEIVSSEESDDSDESEDADWYDNDNENEYEDEEENLMILKMIVMMVMKLSLMILQIKI